MRRNPKSEILNPKVLSFRAERGILSSDRQAKIPRSARNDISDFFRDFLRISALLVLLAALPLGAAAAGDGGSSAAEFLRLGTGARAPARGDAVTADPSGVLALHYNPAGLGTVERGEVEGMYQEAVLGMGHGSFGFVHPIGARAGWGIGGQYINYGKTNRTTIATVAGVSTLSGAGVFDGHDLEIGISYGHSIADWSAGVTMKAVSSQYDNVGATAFAMDIGAMWRARFAPVMLGLAVKNLGTQMRFDRAREDLPLLGRIGAAWTPWEGRLRFTVDAEKARNEEITVMSGIEFTPVSFMTFRAGYDGRNDLGSNWSVGAGFHHNDFTLDYAYIPSGKIGENHRFALGFQFGPGRSAGEAR